MTSVLSVIVFQKLLTIYSLSAFTRASFGNSLNLISTYWSLLSSEQREINLKTVLIGVIDIKCDLLNYLIVLGKLHLWNCRRKNILPVLPSFEEFVKRKFKVEQLIAAKHNCSKMLKAKWKPFLEKNNL